MGVPVGCLLFIQVKGVLMSAWLDVYESDACGAQSRAGQGVCL